MTRFIIRTPQPSNHFIEIEMIIDNINNEAIIELQLPMWRPGRYQLGNFAKNIRSWKATDSNGKILESNKTEKNKWQVFAANNKKIHVHYNYYAYNMDAGNSWLDNELLYVNGINCFLYNSNTIHEACELILDLNEDIPVASGMNEIKKYHFQLKDFHELVDSPFLASKNLKHQEYHEGGYLFHIWFFGLEHPDWKKLIPNFKAFTKTQLEMMGEFPAKEFHFLNIAPSYQIYHGVEHITSTVITLGPACKLMQGELYDHFLGISCHELFHCWNVKSIRPLEMMPYDYSRENYSQLGYVAEGVTTYYGDYLLLRSGVWDFDRYSAKLNLVLKRHFHNYGRFNLSVADSSFDTWLDGYEQGIPHRKTSIYIKGCLAAFILDISIRKQTQNKASLDDVMKILYFEFAKKGKGYSQKDYKTVIEKIAGTSYDRYFNEIIFGIEPLESYIEDAFDYLGCKLFIDQDASFMENYLGIKISIENDKVKILDTALSSPAESSGISRGDELIAVNGDFINSNYVNEMFEYHKGEEITIAYVNSGKLKECKLNTANGIRYFGNFEILKKEITNKNEIANFNSWSGK